MEAKGPAPIPGVVVASWFDTWAGYHREINPRDDWGSMESTPFFWENVQAQFVRRGLHDFEVAVEASRRVSLLELKKKSDHLIRLVEAAVEVYRERREAFNPANGIPRTRDEARLEARGCLDCGGEGGVATRYVWPEHEGRFRTAGGVTLPVGSAVGFYCACALGRWMRVAEVAEEEPLGKGKSSWAEGKARVDRSLKQVKLLDLAAYPDFLRAEVPWSDQPDNCYRIRPDWWDATAARPFSPFGEGESLRDWWARTREAHRGEAAGRRRESERDRLERPAFGWPRPLFAASSDSPAF